MICKTLLALAVKKCTIFEKEKYSALNFYYTSELSGIVGLGVIGILRTTGVDLTPDPVILPVNSATTTNDWHEEKLKLK